MTQRYTAKDVAGMLGRVSRAASALGIDSSAWGVDEGSKTYGRAWRMYRRDLANGGHHSIGGMSDYLGMTAREAFDTLHTMAQAFEYVADHKGYPHSAA